MIYRHGDVILKQVPELPKNFHIITHQPFCVLAEGETTGHQHVLTAFQSNLLLVETDDHERFVKLDSPAKLLHQEHKPIQVSVGVYEILREREYDFLGHRPVPVED